MGVFLTKCDTMKTRESGKGSQVSFWVCSMRGWRVTMEDTSFVDLSFTPDTSLFCIFDGHGGDEVARFCEHNFSKHLKSNVSFQRKSYKRALKETFLLMDTLMRSDDGKRELLKYKMVGPNQSTEIYTANEKDSKIYSGCTAIVALIVDRKRLFVANAGDCRGLLFKKSGQVLQLNREHKPSDPEELSRIVGAGGVVLNGRIDEILNLSRAIGDLEYKNNFLFEQTDQIISALPDVIEKEIDEDDFGLLLGCDGVYEKLNDFAIRDIIFDRFEDDNSEDKALDDVFDQTVAPALNASFSGYDNMTGILIRFTK